MRVRQGDSSQKKQSHIPGIERDRENDIAHLLARAEAHHERIVIVVHQSGGPRQSRRQERQRLSRIGGNFDRVAINEAVELRLGVHRLLRHCHHSRAIRNCATLDCFVAALLAMTMRMSIKRARIVTLNAALGPLDYRVPEGMHVEPGSVVVVPLGPRQLIGVAWEPERLPTNEVPDSRLRPLARILDVPAIAAPLRRLCEWTADYYLAPLASVLRMVLPSSAALEGPRQLTEYRLTGNIPDRLTAQREKALAMLEARQGTIRELASHAGVGETILRGLVKAGALEAVAVDADRPLASPDPDF